MPNWIHIAPHHLPSLSNTVAAGNMHQLAKELLNAYSGVQHTGTLPTVGDLPHTAFFLDPNNKTEGAIAYLNPHDPAHVVGYCFLKGSQEEMAEIDAAYKTYTAQIPGASPIERLPQEIIRQITAHLWAEKGLWDDNKDTRSLAAVSKTMHGKLREVYKVAELERQWNDLPSLPAEQIRGKIDEIAEFALSDRPVKLTGTSLLAMFKDYVQVVLLLTRESSTYSALDKRAIINISVRIIERLRDAHAQAEALDLLGTNPIPIFMRTFSGDDGVEIRSKLIGIVKEMKDDDAKAHGIAGLGNLFHMGGVIKRESILYAAPLLELAENVKASSDAQDKIGMAFFNVLRHVSSYCNHHYNPAFDMSPLYHKSEDENVEVQIQDRETCGKLENYLARHDFVIPEGLENLSRAGQGLP